MTGIVIVGAGHAAGQAAASLRQEGYQGTVTIIGDESYPPYQRPPLSKQYLAGEQGLDRVMLRGENFYKDKNINVMVGQRVSTIDPAGHQITLTDKSTHHYEKLLLATGSRPRTLNIPGSNLAGIHYLRTIADVDGIREEMAPGKSVVIVGGGYIGLEVAAVCASAGLQVHVLEMENRILQRVTTPTMSSFYHRLHSSHGVNLHTNTQVTGFSGYDRVDSVLCGEERLAADFVIIGIGILPNVELAEQAGLACDNGILVDEHCRTSDPDIFAAGDCTNHPNSILDRRLRLESVPNAMEQARVCANTMLGGDKTYDSIPWFWSDQYDLKLQMVGFSTDADREVVRGDPDNHQFIVFYFQGSTLIAADAVNSAKEFMVCKQMVGKPVDASALADPATDLKSLLN